VKLALIVATPVIGAFRGPFVLLSAAQSVRFRIQEGIQGLLHSPANEFPKLVLDLFLIDLNYIFNGLLFFALGLKCGNFKTNQTKEPPQFCETKPTISII
jgi:hypothetical protein